VQVPFRSAVFLWPARLHLQAVERLVEQHLVRQRSVDAPSAAEELRERELVAWFGRCGRVPVVHGLLF